MVFYFKTRCGNYTLYMGRDKYENEGENPTWPPPYSYVIRLARVHSKHSFLLYDPSSDLIKYGLDLDVWWHVDDLSSAHVYLRMKPGQKLDDIPDDVLLDCAALVKANSIAGCKKSSVYVVYTRWKNLKKTSSMVDGQVGFHRPENVRRMSVEKNNPIVRQIEKTKEERYADLYAEQQSRFKAVQRQKKNEYQKMATEKKQEKLKAQQEKEARSYDLLMTDDNMTNTADVQATADATAAEEYEDDFF